jgi:hypothetical protein
MVFEEDFGRGFAESRRQTYEIRGARTCGDDLVFEYWPKPEVVGTVYSMAFDIGFVAELSP